MILSPVCVANRYYGFLLQRVSAMTQACLHSAGGIRLPHKLDENTTLEIESYSRAIQAWFFSVLILANVCPRENGVEVLLSAKVCSTEEHCSETASQKQMFDQSLIQGRGQHYKILYEPFLSVTIYIETPCGLIQ